MRTRLRDKILFYLWPLRDTIGFVFGNFPMRIGEIYSVLYSFICLFSLRKDGSYNKIDRRCFWVLVLLCLNILLTAVISYNNYATIDQSFFKKFVLRNLLCIFLVFSIYKTNKKYTSNQLESFFRYIVVIEFLSLILFYVFHLHIWLCQILPYGEHQTINVGSLVLNRFCGTASEAGYLVPMLVIPFFYFYQKDGIKSKWSLLCLVMFILTISAFAYIVCFLTAIFLHVKNNGTNKKKYFFKSLSIFSIGIFLSFFALKSTLNSEVVDVLLNKVYTYVVPSSVDETDWSAMDRNQHLNNAWNLFLQGDISNYLFGRGTGGYSYHAKKTSDLLVDDVEEAYNLYLSTLTDRGIMGLIIIVFIFYNIYKIKTDNIISNALWWGILIQLFHYFFVGNLWLYYLWQEVIMLIGYEKFLKWKELDDYNIEDSL